VPAYDRPAAAPAAQTGSSAPVTPP
jgi:hypothetical protein